MNFCQPSYSPVLCLSRLMLYLRTTRYLSTPPLLSPNTPEPHPFNPFFGGDSLFDPYITTLPTMSEENGDVNYLLDQATSNSAARTYSYRSEEHDLQQPQETLATNTSSSHSLHGSIDPTVAALLEQMQKDANAIS